MYLTKRQIDIVLKALKEYDFIKEEIENKIQKGYSIEEIADFLVRFDNMEITNFDDCNEFTYLDFIYKNINTCVIKNKNENTIKVSDVLEIYDDLEQKYIIEDWLTKKDYLYEIGMVSLDRIEKALKYCEESSLTIKSHYFSDLENILRGDEINE